MPSKAPSGITRETPRERTFRLFAGAAALASAPVAVANLGLMACAVGGQLSVLSQPLLLLRVGTVGAELWRWSMIADLFGYYLLIVPLIMLLRDPDPQRRDPWRSLFGLSLLGYCFVGAIGAAVFAASTPGLIAHYPASAGAVRDALQVASRVQADEVYRGLWNLLEVLLAAVGWIGFGLDQGRARSIWGGLSLLAGTGALVDFGGSLIGAEAISVVGLALYLTAAPLWAAWAGASVLREPAPTADTSFMPESGPSAPRA